MAGQRGGHHPRRNQIRLQIGAKLGREEGRRRGQGKRSGRMNRSWGEKVKEGSTYGVKAGLAPQECFLKLPAQV